MTPDQHRRTVEIERIIDSDNEAPRCGCPAVPWPLHIGREIIWEPPSGSGILTGDVVLVAMCFGCGATWEWGETCAGGTPRGDSR